MVHRIHVALWNLSLLAQGGPNPYRGQPATNLNDDEDDEHEEQQENIVADVAAAASTLQAPRLQCTPVVRSPDHAPRPRVDGRRPARADHWSATIVPTVFFI